MNEQLQQQLMEFVFGLLDEGEADALGERITSDPQVARAYAKVKLQCDLVAEAARCDTPTLSWSRPGNDTSANADVGTTSKVSDGTNRRRFANWCIGIAASGLICLMGSGHWMSSRSTRDESPVAFASTTPVTVVLTGPSELHAEASNPFTIQVKDQAGTPVSTTLNCRVYDGQGAVSWEDSKSTDRFGLARFDVDAGLARDESRLEITTADESPAPILRELEVTPERFATYLRMDRPIFQPGERVSYRSVTLSRFGLRSDREVKTSFEIVNASDEPIEGAANTVETKHGVGSGSNVLPSDLPDGIYTLIARSPDNLFREEWRDFHVRRYTAPRLLKKLELAQDSYTLGDQVDVDFSVERVAGKPLAELPLQVQATLDGQALAAPQAKTDADGNSRFSLLLPESIDRGEASVSVTVQAGDEPAETITKEIPINLGRVNVDFYPEGGDLVAGLPSRVYFYGRDPLGKPTHIEGRIVDSGNHEITEIVTGHEGRGVFSLTPVADEQYRLLIDRPASVTKEIPLPATDTDCFAAIETGRGVFAANAPIAFTLLQRTPLKRLIVVAYCRGAMVAQQTIDSDAYGVDQANVGTFRGQLDLPAQAQGVVRLTVFDAVAAPPKPIAERLVYRRVGQKLNVDFTADAETFAPGQDVEILLSIKDENDVPIPAALGILVVDDAVLNLADDKSMRMPTYFHLLTDIDSPEQLEDANFYLSDSAESVAALDSLLGTQGWRRFREVPAMQLAQSPSEGFGGGGFGYSYFDRKPDSRYRSEAWFDETVVPLSTVATIVPVAAISRTGKIFAFPIIIASVGLLLLVGITSLRPIRGNRSLRVCAGVIAAVSLLLGVINLPMKPSLLSRATDVAAVTDSVHYTHGIDESGATSAPAVGAPWGDEADTDTARAESFMYAANDAPMPSAEPSSAEPLDSESLKRLDVVPIEAARFAEPGQLLGRAAELPASEKAMGLPASKAKKEATPAPDARPLAEAAATPETSRSGADVREGRDAMIDEQRQFFSDKDALRSQTREYAKWFYSPRASEQPNGPSSSTIFWVPLFVADKTGQARIYFTLPQRPSSFRAIVEAHGADRLGSGELLIDSQER